MTTQEVISKNITSLRKKNRMTQAELADKLSYTEQAISKWERGLSLPDAVMLKTIADLFNVPIEYMYQEHEYEALTSEEEKALNHKELRIKITFIVSSLIIILALAATIFSYYFDAMGIDKAKFALFFIPLIVSLIGVINFFFGRKKYTRVFVSVTVWTLANSFYIYYLKRVPHIILVYAIALIIQVLIVGIPTINRYFIDQRLKARQENKKKKEGK